MSWATSCAVAATEPRFVNFAEPQCGASVIEDGTAFIRRCRTGCAPGDTLCALHKAGLAQDVKTYKSLPLSSLSDSIVCICEWCAQEPDSLLLDLLRNCFSAGASVLRVCRELADISRQLHACSIERYVVQQKYFQYAPDRETASHVYFYKLQRRRARLVDAVLQRFDAQRKRVEESIAQNAAAARVFALVKKKVPVPDPVSVPVPKQGKHDDASTVLTFMNLRALHGGDDVLAFSRLSAVEHRVYLALHSIAEDSHWMLFPVTRAVVAAMLCQEWPDEGNYFLYVVKTGGVFLYFFCDLQDLNEKGHTLCLSAGTLRASSTFFGVVSVLFARMPVWDIIRRGMCGRYSQVRRNMAAVTIGVQEVLHAPVSGNVYFPAAQHAAWFQQVDEHRAENCTAFTSQEGSGGGGGGGGVYAILRSDEYGYMSRLLAVLGRYLAPAQGRRSTINLEFRTYRVNLQDVAAGVDVELLLPYSALKGKTTYAGVLGRKTNVLADGFSLYYSPEIKCYSSISGVITLADGPWWFIADNWWLDVITVD